jgi:ABC-type dipeptide/oligopeptide/nickel transport system permease subunit
VEATLGGVLIIGVAVAAISALIGTLTTLLVGWRKYRCVTHHEELLKHE